MADIELVIKIPEEVYEHTLKAKSVPDMLGIDIVNTINAIRNGTPLPKGHGRLIDADAMWDSYHSNDYNFYEALDDVQTIIEAESEVLEMSNDKNIFDSEYMYRIVRQLKETEEEFAYELISPFCERVVKKTLSKKELERILRKGMQHSNLLEKVKQAREEIENIEPLDFLEITKKMSSNGKEMEISKKFATAILDKLIESEGVND